MTCIRMWNGHITFADMLSPVKTSLTSDKEHDDEDDWEAPEGNGYCLQCKVFHTVKLLQPIIMMGNG